MLQINHKLIPHCYSQNGKQHFDLNFYEALERAYSILTFVIRIKL